MDQVLIEVTTHSFYHAVDLRYPMAQPRLAALLALMLILVASPLTPMLSGAPSRKSVEIDGDLTLRGSDRMLIEDTDLVVHGRVIVGGDALLTLRRSSLTMTPTESLGQAGLVQVNDRASFEAFDSTIYSRAQTGVAGSGSARLILDGVTVFVTNPPESTHYVLEDWTFHGILAPYMQFSRVSISQNASLTAERLTVGYVGSNSKGFCSLKDSEIGVLSPVRQGVTLLNGTSVNLLQLLGTGSGPVTGSHEGAHRAWNSSQLGDLALPDVRLVDSTIRHIWLTAVGNVTLRDADLTIVVLNGGSYRVEGGDIWLLALLNGGGVSEVVGTKAEYLATFSFGSADAYSIELRGVTAQNTKFYSPMGRRMDVRASGSYLGGCVVNWGAPPDSSYEFTGIDMRNVTLIPSESLSVAFHDSSITDGLSLADTTGGVTISGDVRLGNHTLATKLVGGTVTINRSFPVEVNRAGAPVSGALLDLRRGDQTIWAGETGADGMASFDTLFTGGFQTGNLTATLRLFTTYKGETIITPVGLLSDTPVTVSFPLYTGQEGSIIAVAVLAALLVFLAYIARKMRVA